MLNARDILCYTLIDKLPTLEETDTWLFVETFVNKISGKVSMVDYFEDDVTEKLQNTVANKTFLQKVTDGFVGIEKPSNRWRKYKRHFTKVEAITPEYTERFQDFFTEEELQVVTEKIQFLELALITTPRALLIGDALGEVLPPNVKELYTRVSSIVSLLVGVCNMTNKEAEKFISEVGKLQLLRPNLDTITIFQTIEENGGTCIDTKG